ncbi:MAG: hypothetical protein ACREDS_03015 [Limisphaerales bacterium]
MMQLIHMTATYSNAVLVAILPHISNCARQLDLPLPQPITANQVAHFNVSPRKEDVGGSVWLTNHYQFVFGNGYLRAYQAPTNWFNNQYDNWADTEYFKRYLGKDNMTTNEAIEFARHSFYKLGYKPKDFDIRGPPTRFEGPINSKRLGHLPYCEVEWDSPTSTIQQMLGLNFNIQFDVDMQRKQIVGMNLSGRLFFRPNPKIAVVPEVETNYRNAGWIGAMAQMENREPIIHMTPAYSNATLTATLPYISDFAKRLDLPIAQPVIASQVVLSVPPQYKPPHAKNYFEERLMLANHYWFSFVGGYVCQFGSPDDWFEEKETRTNWPRCDSKDCMTTNEAIEFARAAFRKLGYKPEEFHLNVPPTTYTNATDMAKQYAYCQIDWDSPESEQGTANEYHMEFDINTQRKQMVGMLLMSKGFVRPEPKIDVEPELESDYLKRVQGHMFVRTNAPSHLPQAEPFQFEMSNHLDLAQTNSPSP